MDEKREAELRLIQAALAFHKADIGYQYAVEKTSIFTVESRLRGEHDFETERSEYIRARIEITLACERYAELFKPAPAGGERNDV